MTDAQFMGLIKQLHLKKRGEAISRLLAGNDTCCFTTEQYMRQLSVVCKIDLAKSSWWRQRSREQLAEEGFEEVQPDVWAKPIG